MSLLNDTDIAELRSAWESALMDSCILQTRVAGSTDYGYGQPSYTDATTETACWFEPLVTDEAVPQVPVIDGHVIFKRTATINNLMRVKITKLHGDTVSQVYEIVGGPMLHHMGQKVRVKLVMNGTAS